MKSSRKAGIFDYDWLTVLVFNLLVIIGIISIYSATYDEQSAHLFQTYYGKQTLFFAFSYVLILFISFIPLKTIKNNASLLYLFGLVLLVLVLLIGSNINGNKSWFRLGSFGLQPAEFVKLFTILGLAKLLTEPDFKITRLKNFLQASILILTPVFLILLQPDLGSAIVFIALFLVLYREGLSIYYYLFALLIATLFIVTIYFGNKPVILAMTALIIFFNLFAYYKTKQIYLWQSLGIWLISLMTIIGTGFVFNKILKPHQRNRIEIVLGKKKDDKGTGYNLKQALIAIGSGGLTGKGMMKGSQTKGDYIPAQHTDWILTVIGEQWGFLGTLTVILLYTFLLIRLIFLAERQKQKFSRILGYGVVSILFLHYALNILMVLGLFPTIGIPLPFLSYGGSSLWAFTLMLFIFLKFDAHRIEDW
ncbi:MAG TPA: rod shape-determining protein RodA [Flavobacteriales bacterium]|jgi:rod shape determining protein RodA|nr:rod shape-determining protein RodA [Flavobacteriales bacterium]